MYFPYFRGKQNELILLRDKADFIACSKIVPIIEPVKANVNPIRKCLSLLDDNGAEFILVANPKYGDFSKESHTIEEKVCGEAILKSKSLILGYILNVESKIDQVLFFLKMHKNKQIALIHYGFLKGSELAAALTKIKNISYHIFIDGKAHKRYRKYFKSTNIDP